MVCTRTRKKPRAGETGRSADAPRKLTMNEMCSEIPPFPWKQVIWTCCFVLVFTGYLLYSEARAHHGLDGALVLAALALLVIVSGTLWFIGSHVGRRF
jgi:hypothetical protein